MWLSDTLPEEEDARRRPRQGSVRPGSSPLPLEAHPTRRAPEPISRLAPHEEASSKPSDGPSGFERAAGLLRTALPFVQRFLPLVEGPVGAVLSGVLTPRTPKSTSTSTPANLVPVQKSLARLEAQHQALCEQVAEQNSTLHRVEDRLQSVREATDRNTLEQQELMEDLKAVGRKVNVITVVLGGLLLVSVLLNLILFLHLERVLP